MSTQLEVEARTVGAGLQSQGFAFDPTGIISIAFALWQVCLHKRDPRANPAAYLRTRFNDGQFDQELLDEARHGARKANRIAFRRGKSPKRHLEDDELDLISTNAFLHVMDADDDVVKACGLEASGMSFDDVDDAE